MQNKEKQALFREANAFYELAEHGRKNISEQKFIESYIPYIVNMSFASELYLKLLLIHNGQTIHCLKKLGHNLHSLYNELEQSQKDKIYESFKRPLVYNINAELEQINTAFQDWRYLVLNKANNISTHLQYKPFFIKEFNEILQNMCEDIF